MKPSFRPKDPLLRSQVALLWGLGFLSESAGNHGLCPTPSDARTRCTQPFGNFQGPRNFQEKGFPDAFLPGLEFRTSGQRVILRLAQVRSPIVGLGFPAKFLFCPEELGRRVVWARARSQKKQIEDGCKGAWQRGTLGGPSPGTPGDKARRGWARLGWVRSGWAGRPGRACPQRADGLSCQKSSMRRAHQKALTSLN